MARLMTEAEVEAKSAKAREAWKKNVEPILTHPLINQSVVVMLLTVHTVSEANSRDHWAKKAKRVAAQRRFSHWCLEAHILRGGLVLPFPLIVTLTRIAPRELDGDNLQSALKATRDGIADYFGVDDRDPRIEWCYGQEKGRVREYAVRVEIVPKE